MNYDLFRYLLDSLIKRIILNTLNNNKESIIIIVKQIYTDLYIKYIHEKILIYVSCYLLLKFYNHFSFKKNYHYFKGKYGIYINVLYSNERLIYSHFFLNKPIGN